jgi:hypothetical protein
VNIIVHGLMRFRIVEMISADPFMLARIETHEDETVANPQIEALIHTAEPQGSVVQQTIRAVKGMFVKQP